MPRLTSLRPRVATLDTRTAKPAPKTADEFYTSSPWRKLVDSIIAERGPICEDTTCQARHYPGMRVFGDHIVEIKDGGAPLDRRNVQLLCGSAHTRKTAQARARRMMA